MANDLFNTIQSSFSALYRTIDLILIAILFILALYLHDVPLTTQYELVLLISITCFLFFSQTIDLYRSWRTSSTLMMLGYTSLTWIICCIVLISIAYFSKTGSYYSRFAMGIWFISTMVVLNLWRIALRSILFYFRRSGLNTKQVIIIGATPTGINLANQIENNPQLGLEIVGFFDDRPLHRLPGLVKSSLKGTIEEGINLVKENSAISEVYIAMPMKAENRITDILNKCSDTTATVHIIPDFFIYNILHARWQYIGNMQTLSIFDSPFQGLNHTLKRVEDLIIGSLILIIITIPMCFIALAVKFSSKGPVIFKQKRYGLDGKEIKIYKFRSMALVAKKN